MMAKWACESVVIYFIFVTVSVINLWSFADDNAAAQRDINDPQPFRLNKLNMMWDKAKKVTEIFYIRYSAW